MLQLLKDDACMQLERKGGEYCDGGGLVVVRIPGITRDMYEEYGTLYTRVVRMYNCLSLFFGWIRPCFVEGTSLPFS